MLVSSITLSQPKERLKNRYKEPNMSYGAPYTMFDIADHANDKTIGIVNKIQEIRILTHVHVDLWSVCSNANCIVNPK